MSFADNVLQLLKDKGLSQSDLAKKLNKPRQNVSTLLKKNSPSMQTLREFAEALEVTQDQLLRDNPIVFKAPELTELKKLIEKNSYAYVTKDESQLNARPFYHRLYDFMIERNIRDTDLATRLGIEDEDLYEIFEGKHASDKRLIQKILEALPELNKSWLLEGEGDMISESYKDWGDFGIVRDNFRLLSQENSNEWILLRDSKILVTSPYITEERQNEYLNNLNNQKYLDGLERHGVVLQYVSWGAYRSFEVTTHDLEGDMYCDQIIYKGSIVTGRKIESKNGSFDISHSQTPIIVIVTSSEIIISRLLDNDKSSGIITYSGLNSTSMQTEINVKDIAELYLVEVATRELGVR